MNVMASFNRVILMGNLTRDPELRVTPQGTSVCKINVAVIIGMLIAVIAYRKI